MSKKYRVIYADPPWDFENKIGCIGSNVKDHYETLTIERIKNIDISKISKKDAVLFLWCCEANLKEAIQVIEAWGFRYKTVAFVWIKTKNGKRVTNPAPWTSKCCEFCLLGTKGSVNKYVKTRPHELVVSERNKHSEKPENVRKRIEQMFPKSLKIELFARKKVKGWDCFGNEIESDVDIDV